MILVARKSKIKRCRQVYFLLRPLSWLVDCGLLPVSLHGLASVKHAFLVSPHVSKFPLFVRAQLDWIRAHLTALITPIYQGVI